MIKVRGIYDGTHVRLLEELDVPPETEVEVIVLDREAAEQAFRLRLIELGIVFPAEPVDGDEDEDDFEPIPIVGAPISETIIRERR